VTALLLCAALFWGPGELVCSPERLTEACACSECFSWTQVDGAEWYETLGLTASGTITCSSAK